MRGCGHSKYKTFCSEDCAMDAHDLAHEDPLEHDSECAICNERINDDIIEGLRTPDGDLIEEKQNAAN